MTVKGPITIHDNNISLILLKHNENLLSAALLLFQFQYFLQVNDKCTENRLPNSKLTQLC